MGDYLLWQPAIVTIIVYVAIIVIYLVNKQSLTLYIYNELTGYLCIHVRMAAAYPLPSFTTIKESASKQLTRRSCRKVAVIGATDVIPDVSDPSNEDSTNAGFCGEPFADNGELLSSLSPLLFSMKLFGLYFHREDPHRRRTDDPEWNPATTTTRTSSNRLRVYATVILILVWLNAVRFTTVFTRQDRFGAELLMKIMMVTWFCLTAIFQTAYYYASHTGQLTKIMSTLPVSRRCVRGARRFALGITVFIWITMAADLAAGSYFYFSSDRFDFIITPFVTHIYVPEENMKTARILAYMTYALIFPGVFLSHSMNQLLVYVFYFEYKKLKRNFRRTLGERGQFAGDLSLFRRRHRAVDVVVQQFSVDVTRRSVVQ